MPDAPVILALESSCDDTAAAVVAGGTLRSSVVSIQHEHDLYGGVVAGTVVKIHVTFVLFLVWIAGATWRAGGLEAALATTAFVLLLFSFITLATSDPQGLGYVEVELGESDVEATTALVSASSSP